ncbi:alpha-tectorin-like [Astyanax mexicanus]|uniref:Alpha-tectorin-like n=1 Tax=Astyanax mexicanus TaxID=7994 RepID=A0A8T2L7G0_ASTMX|nr:alpha-tectorin-like [Astyanax mexicanus]
MGYPLTVCVAALLILSTVEHTQQAPIKVDYFNSSLLGDELNFAGANFTKLTLPGVFKYFGSLYDTIYVSVNGYLSFSPLSNVTDVYSDASVISPLMTDVTSGGHSFKVVTDGPFLQQASEQIGKLFPEIYFSANYFYVITWENVSFASNEGGATFQVVLLSGDDVSVILMNYKHVDFTEQEWMTGYWTADGIHLFTINEASSSDLSTGSNVRTPGLWAFRVDGKSYGSCDDLNCTEREVCDERTGVYGCVCSKDNPRLNPDTFDATEVCESSKGTLSLSRCQLFEAGFPAEYLHLRDHRCRGKIQDDMVVFHFDNDQNVCGTNLKSNKTHFVYENVIQMIYGEESKTVISRQRWVNIAFSCAYPLIQTLDMPMDFKAQKSVVSKDLDTAGTYEIYMLPFPNASFVEPYHGEVTLDVNQQIFVAVVVDKVDSSQIATVLDECWATPDNDSSNHIRWDLIINECPNPDDGTVEVITNGASTASYFSFRMFTFTGVSDKVYLHCKVHLCLINGGECAQSCSDDSIQVRRRRALEFHDTAAITMGF